MDFSPSEYDVYVQLSPISSVKLRLLHLNTLLLAPYADPDLALVSPGLRPCVLQNYLYVLDVITFLLAGLGKTMMKHFFLTGTQEITLADTAPGRESVGFLSLTLGAHAQRGLR